MVHLGHDRSVEDVVTAALQEDVQGVAVSLLPGRPRRVLHLPRRAARPSAVAGHVQVFGGGGGVIVPEEIAGARRRRRTDLLARRRPAPRPAGDDQRARRRRATSTSRPRRVDLAALRAGAQVALARAITVARDGSRRGPGLGRARGGRRAARADPGHHRHRWIGQVLAHRRARTPIPTGPAGQGSASPCSPSTRPGAAAAARCSATGSG